MVKTLVDFGANIEEADQYGATALIMAASEGHVETVKILLERGADPHARDRNSWTALMWAQSMRHAEVISVLAKYEKGIQKKSIPRGIASNRSIEATRRSLISSRGFPMNEKLLRYSAEGNLEKALALLDKGANPNVSDEYGYTPLLLAASEGKEELEKVLIERGADVNAKTTSGWTALLWAASMGYAEIVNLLAKKDSLEVGRNGATPLMKACRRGYFDVTTTLLENGANVNSKDDYGWTPLMRACRKGYFDIIKILLDHGADTEASDQYGATALIISASEFNINGVKLLLERGANPNATDRNGWTALRWASSMRYDPIVKILESFSSPNPNPGQLP